MSLERKEIGRYQLLGLVGRGGMGEVYQAEDTQLRRKVAIKVILTDSSLNSDQDESAEASRLFVREARAIAQLNHPRIVPVYDFGEGRVDGRDLSYMVMPFYPDGSFAQWLRQHLNSSGSLNWNEVSHFIAQAADALYHAHQHQITHRDIKPANFLMRPVAEQPQLPDLLLTDFGVARFLTETVHESRGSRGTPAYMAPEQWSGDAVPASDQYALAVLAYELLTGQLPFRGRLEQVMYQHLQMPPQPPSQLNPRLPAFVDQVLLRALAKTPAERFAHVKAFASALSQALQNTPEQSAPTVVRPLTPVPPVPYSTGPATPLPPVRDNNQAQLAPTLTPATMPVTDGSPHTWQAEPPSSSLPGSVTNPFSLLPGSRPPARSRRSMLLLLLLIPVLIAGSIGGTALYLTHNGPSAPVTTVSSPTISTSSATGTPGATRTPASSATSTTSTNNALANPYSPHTGTVAINDPLSDNSKGYDWNDLRASTYGCSFINGAYHVLQTASNWYTTCFAEHENLIFSNFTFQVQMSIFSGDCGGLAFRADPSENKFYFFRVCQDGTYDLRLIIDNTNRNAQTLIGQNFNGAIYPGLNVTNTLAVVAQGPQLTLYVNQHNVGSFFNTAFASGKIAVAASSLSNSTEAVFTNAILWQQ